MSKITALVEPAPVVHTETTVRVYTMPQLARRIGVHRSTLTRWMQTRAHLLPKPSWVEYPVRGWVYTEEQAAQMQEAMHKYHAQRFESHVLIDPRNLGKDKPDADAN